MKIQKNRRSERLCDGVATRLTPTQRRFLEAISEENKIPIGESVRLLIDREMARSEAI